MHLLLRQHDVLPVFLFMTSFTGCMCRPRSPVPTALKLESSAPPMDLDRPQGALATPLDLSQRPPVLNEAAPIASNASAMAEPAPSSEPSTGRDALSFGLKTAVATKPEAVNQSAVASDAELALKPDRAQSAEGEPAAETTEAEPAVAAESNALRTESAAGNPLTTLDKPVQLRTDDRSQGLVLPLQNSTSGVAVHAPGVVADKLAVASAPAGDEPTEGQAKGNDGQGERQEGKGGGSDAGRGHKEATEEVLPSTEEDLDGAMQELAHEVRYVPCLCLVGAGMSGLLHPDGRKLSFDWPYSCGSQPRCCNI